MNRTSFWLLVSLLIFAPFGTGQTGDSPIFARSIITAPGTPVPHYYFGSHVEFRDIVQLRPVSPSPIDVGLFVIDSGGFGSNDSTFWDGDRLREYYPFLRKGITIFILLHPDGTDSTIPGVPPQSGSLSPVWLVPEIEEYLRQSILAVKKLFHPQTAAPENVINKWVIGGGSSGGTLALNIGLANAVERLTDLSFNPPVHTGMDAVIANSAGIDPLNYRFTGDYSWVNRTCSSLVHPDLSGVVPGMPAPSYMRLPSHYPAPQQMTFPSPGNLFIAGNAGSPTYQRFPENYLASTSILLPIQPMNNLMLNFISPDDPDTFDSSIFSLFAAETDPNLQTELENWQELDPSIIPTSGTTIYSALPAGWRTYIAGDATATPPIPGQRVIDKVDPTDPPVFYRHGDGDYIVHHHQAEIYMNAWSTFVAGTPPVFVDRVGQGHVWRDIDDDDGKAIINFIEETCVSSSLKDVDFDGLPDALDVFPNASSKSDPDIDGDGLPDGHELAFERFFNPSVTASTSNLIANPEKLLRIEQVSRMLSPSSTPANPIWSFGFRFKGPAGLSYVIQSTDHLVEDVGSGDMRFEPHWTDVSASGITLSTVQGGIQSGAFNTNIATSGAKGRFYRVAVRSLAGGSEFIASAPVGVLRNVIKRDVTNDYENYICQPFHSRAVGTYRLESVVAGVGVTSLNLRMPPSGIQASTLGPDTSLISTNALQYTHYAIVERDNTVARPVENPDNNGFEGHWWFIDSAISSSGSVVGVNVVERTSQTSGIVVRADQLPAAPFGTGASLNISIRPLPSVGGIFDGAQVVGSSLLWYADNGYQGEPSCFRDGDRIDIVKRRSFGIQWPTLPGQLPMSTSMIGKIDPLHELKFSTSGAPTGQGQWQEVSSGLPVNLFEYRLRLDEAIVYTAVADVSQNPDLESEFFCQGWVPTSDLFGYANADNGLPFGIFQNDQVNPIEDVYGVTVMGWPFPEPSILESAASQTSGFFEHFSVTAPVQALITSPNGGAFLIKGDVDSPNFWGDGPPHGSIFFGADQREYLYFFPKVNTVGVLQMDASIGTIWLPPSLPQVVPANPYLPWYNSSNGASSSFSPPAADVTSDGYKFRPGRGFTVFTNMPDDPDPVNNPRITQWRMRRPYRRP